MQIGEMSGAEIGLTQASEIVGPVLLPGEEDGLDRAGTQTQHCN